ncbi:flagellar biosynthetic protein FliR [Gracilimonas mengyeensis]|uniref:Flagellar biosynthetic protein FliR n=1 Tax=Gracilimonas mengyeensis TaxID=1302730 RepID=A0A521EBZ2_9BACT|nr:flagellar biosynthetic protein FliR [Gracilimonas mengyeensis]SMO81468.1 flagellar biosynthetic protein FliR [Gracilimonas mengyeensis]
MESLSIDLILSAFLVFVRVAAVVMTAPFFNTAAFPKQIKIYLSIVTTVLLFAVIPAESTFVSASDGMVFIVTAIIMEILVGAALGLVGQLVFAGLEMAGMLISLNTALSFANMVDTMTQKQSAIISNIFMMIAVLVFLSIEGDKIYISALAKSFEVVPVNDSNIHLAGPFMLEIATYLFVIGVQITTPFLIVIFLLDVSLAIFARIMPQANMMFIALPIKVGVGIALLMLAIPYLPTAFEMMFLHIYDFLGEIIGVIAP